MKFHGNSTVSNDASSHMAVWKIGNRTTFAHTILFVYTKTTYFLTNNFLTNLNPFLINIHN